MFVTIYLGHNHLRNPFYIPYLILHMKHTHEDFIESNIDGKLMSLPANVHHADWEKLHAQVANFAEKLPQNELDEFASALEDYFDFSNPNFGSKAREVWSVFVNNTLPRLRK